MSGTFEQMDVPPTLVSFAVTTGKTDQVISPEFKGACHKVALLAPETDENGLPTGESLLSLFRQVTDLMRQGKVLAAYTPGMGGPAEAVFKMAIGNRLGFVFDGEIPEQALFARNYGSFVLELSEDVPVGVTLGHTAGDPVFTMGNIRLPLSALQTAYENKLEPVYACNLPAEGKTIPAFTYEAGAWPAPAVKTARPRVLIPVFPGTNCEYDTAKALERAGAEARILVVNNLTSQGVARSVERFAQELRQAQMVFLPGGFSGGDEPDGSGKFITAFFRNQAVKEETMALLSRRDGLMAGVCNGFQALIKLGLVPFGEIVDTDENCPTLTYNVIGRHQSRMVRTRIASNKSPWLKNTRAGEIYTVPISHGEGRFIASEELVRRLAENGQIATQYVDLEGLPTDDIRFNPNGSVCAIEGITSPDGRVFGKMGHSERIGAGLYRNVPGEYDMKMFEAAVDYFRK